MRGKVNVEKEIDKKFELETKLEIELENLEKEVDEKEIEMEERQDVVGGAGSLCLLTFQFKFYRASLSWNLFYGW